MVDIYLILVPYVDGICHVLQAFFNLKLNHIWLSNYASLTFFSFMLCTFSLLLEFCILYLQFWYQLWQYIKEIIVISERNEFYVCMSPSQYLVQISFLIEKIDKLFIQGKLWTMTLYYHVKYLLWSVSWIYILCLFTFWMCNGHLFFPLCM